MYLSGNNTQKKSNYYMEEKGLNTKTYKYCCFEYLEQGLLNDKIDVYSMGVVIFVYLTA